MLQYWQLDMNFRKILFGSQILRLRNPRDIDDFIFYEEPYQQKPSIIGRTKWIECFKKGLTCPEDQSMVCWLYQYSGAFHENVENYPWIDFDIFEHKERWINQLKSFINLPSTEEFALSRKILHKRFYHLMYQYYMITENVYYISEEGMEYVQKIHDFEMPNSFFYELREKINSL